MWIILNWSSGYDDVIVVTAEAGYPALFGTLREATEYASRELNHYWKVVNLEEEEVV